MADKQISDLTAATQILPPDLFVLEQDGTAKKLTGQLLVSWMTSYADGHGGIQSITWQNSGVSGNGQLHNATIHYADGTTSTFSVRDGYKGDTGAAWYVYIKYSADRPTRDSDMGDDPDDWMGIYSGTSQYAPSSYTSYTWYNIKGQTGDPAEIIDNEVEYQAGTTGTVPPSGQWSTNIPIVSPGNYLWTRTTIAFNSGNPFYVYASARQGVDGSGAPSDEIPLADIAGGSVGESTSFSRADHQHPSPLLEITANLTTLPTTISNSAIKADMRVVDMSFGTISALTSDIAWSTSDGNIALSGTMSGSTTVDIVLAIF